MPYNKQILFNRALWVHMSPENYLKARIHIKIVVMCDNDFWTLSIIMIIPSRSIVYHDSKSKW